MTGRHLLCRVVRFESIRVDATTFSTPMRNIFLSLLQIDFWYAFRFHVIRDGFSDLQYHNTT